MDVIKKSVKLMIWRGQRKLELLQIVCSQEQNKLLKIELSYLRSDSYIDRRIRVGVECDIFGFWELIIEKIFVVVSLSYGCEFDLVLRL